MRTGTTDEHTTELLTTPSHSGRSGLRPVHRHAEYRVSGACRRRDRDRLGVWSALGIRSICAGSAASAGAGCARARA